MFLSLLIYVPAVAPHPLRGCEARLLSLKGNPFINGLARKFIKNINTDFVTGTV